MSSFRKRTEESKPIPGTRSSLYNGQTITSTGNPSLDHILGGGVQIGSLLIVEEDQHIVYSKVLAKYFLAEGVISKQPIFFGSIDDEPDNLIKKLPKPVEEEQISKDPEPSMQDMRIAWRYNNLPHMNSEQIGQKIGHHYNLLEQMSDEELKGADISTWSNSKGTFRELIEKLHQKSKTAKEDSVLRICLTSIGSPLWYSTNFSEEILKFLTIFRYILRTCNAVGFVTIPTNILEKYDDKLVDRIRSLSDYCIQLDAFAGTSRESNPAFKEYNGILNIKRLSALNTLSSYSPETTDLAFKLRRKKFVIEKFHLPPELQDPDQPQDEIVPSLSCGSAGNKKLDF